MFMIDDTHHHDGAAPDPGASLRSAVRDLASQVDHVLELAEAGDAADAAHLGALLDLLPALDRGHAAAVELTATVQHTGAAERSQQLPLEQLLAFQSRATHGDRRTLCAAADILGRMPHLRRAFHAGLVGFAEVRAVLARAHVLSAEQRAELDAGFADHGHLAGLEADRLVDAVDDAVARLRPELERERGRRAIERRFLSLQGHLDGGLSGYFELDSEAGATVAEALHAAGPGPSAGPRDITRDAVGEGEEDAEDEHDPDGEPAFCDPVGRRSLARRRADGLLHLAESFLGGHRGSTGPGAHESAGDGSGGAGDPCGGDRAGDLAGRPRPRLFAIADIADLTGHGPAAHAARALLAHHGGRLRLTSEAVRRLRCDASLQFLLTDEGRPLGITEPTVVVPAAVRQAVLARDQGCRFPGCRAPVHWCDTHHVVFRQHDGPTTVDNLVSVCRRHHTAVHEGGWRLTMDDDGTVTVRRGRQRAASAPPWRRALPP